MKKLMLISSFIAFIALTMSFTFEKSKPNQVVYEQTNFQIPDNVKQIIDNSCYGCHNDDSKNTKGKLKLNFDKLPELKTGKLAGKLMKIHDEVEKSNMPPKKFLNNYPERALTAEQSEQIKSWAMNLAKEYGE